MMGPCYSLSSFFLLVFFGSLCQARLLAPQRSQNGTSQLSQNGTLQLSQNGTLQLSQNGTLQDATIGVYMLGKNGDWGDWRLPECAGECDDDDDCDDGLICFQHAKYQRVPGCLGGEDDGSDSDYCIRDPSTLSEAPSASLSVSPTEGPTTTRPPTEFPTFSAAPSPVASVAPSPSPSVSPTGAPTQTVVAVGPFQLKLHWTRRSCWQDICNRETDKWCMQCEGHQCNEGDLLWVEDCREDAPYQQLFHWLPLFSATETADTEGSKWGHLQAQSSSGETLCFQRQLYTQNHTLQACNASIPEQWYRGFDAEEPFELQANTVDKVQSNCLTTPHHPRQFEPIWHTSCRQARVDNVSLWRAIWPNMAEATEKSFDERRYYRLGEARREPSCTIYRRCGMCQGHCHSDEECEGNLKCFERSGSNPTTTPPGCFGNGIPRMDYCHAKPGN